MESAEGTRLTVSASVDHISVGGKMSTFEAGAEISIGQITFGHVPTIEIGASISIDHIDITSGQSTTIELGGGISIGQDLNDIQGEVGISITSISTTNVGIVANNNNNNTVSTTTGTTGQMMNEHEPPYGNDPYGPWMLEAISLASALSISPFLFMGIWNAFGFLVRHTLISGWIWIFCFILSLFIAIFLDGPSPASIIQHQQQMDAQVAAGHQQGNLNQPSRWIGLEWNSGQQLSEQTNPPSVSTNNSIPYKVIIPSVQNSIQNEPTVKDTITKTSSVQEIMSNTNNTLPQKLQQVPPLSQKFRQVSPSLLQDAIEFEELIIKEAEERTKFTYINTKFVTNTARTDDEPSSGFRV